MSQVGTKEHVLKAAWQNRPVVELHCYPVSGREKKNEKVENEKKLEMCSSSSVNNNNNNKQQQPTSLDKPHEQDSPEESGFSDEPSTTSHGLVLHMALLALQYIFSSLLHTLNPVSGVPQLHVSVFAEDWSVFVHTGKEQRFSETAQIKPVS